MFDFVYIKLVKATKYQVMVNYFLILKKFSLKKYFWASLLFSAFFAKQEVL